jgi:hypothetical protein
MKTASTLWSDKLPSATLASLCLASILLTNTAPAQVSQYDARRIPDLRIVEDIDVPWVRDDGYQVLLDVRYPIAAPGLEGWPLIVLVHGGGGNRNRVKSAAQSLASSGYITVAYDVRGQGPSMLNNPPSLAHSVDGLRELLDLFETMEATESLYPTLTDFTRIGVTGYSQGGGHTWWAVQHSGRTPPPNPWRVADFPVISAAVVKDSTGGGSGGNELFPDPLINKFFSSSAGFTLDPSGVSAAQALILAEDYAGLDALIHAPGMDKSVLLPLSSVPVFAHASYDDKKVNPSGVFGAFNLLPDSTPKRLQLGTGGHSSPTNLRDRALYSSNRQRWFDRFLKTEANGIDTEPSLFVSVTPDEVATYRDQTSLWDFRIQDDLPALTSTPLRQYLGAAGALINSAAVGTTASTLDHTVPAGLDIASYSSLLPNHLQLQALIPLDRVQYDSSVVAQDQLFQGEAELELSVDTTATEYQVLALLYDVDPLGRSRYVTAGLAAVHDHPGANTLNLKLYLQSYVFRAGHRIRLQLENLAIHSPPTGATPYVKTVPYFTSSSVDILEGGISASWIDLPMLPYAAPTLSTYPPQQSVTNPADQALTVHTHSGFAGAPYLLLPTLSGTSPGTLYLGVQVPINFDALTQAFTSNPTLPPFLNAVGTLDALGSADLGLALRGWTLPAGWAGLDLSMAVLVAAGPHISSNAVTVPFLP